MRVPPVDFSTHCWHYFVLAHFLCLIALAAAVRATLRIPLQHSANSSKSFAQDSLSSCAMRWANLYLVNISFAATDSSRALNQT